MSINKEKIFPQGFLWGGAGSGHQVEGNNINSDWFILEQSMSRLKKFNARPHGDACNHYHMYEDDIKLMADLGYNAYRFSVEWSRIEPIKGRFSNAELDHYKRVAETCHKYDITPVVTYHHFTSPRWFITDYGWEHKNAPDIFADYCEKVTKHMGDLIGYGCTINEANIYYVMAAVLPYVAKMGSGIVPLLMPSFTKKTLGGRPKRFKCFNFVSDFDAIANAHKSAKQAIKSVRSDLPVGWTLALSPLIAAEGAEDVVQKMNHKIADKYYEVSEDDDFLGVQVYARHYIDKKGREIKPAKGQETDAQGRHFDPESLEIALRLAAEKAKVPLLVTENGINTENDTQRVRYINRAVDGVANCLADGIDVKGYLHWSIFDNYEWINYIPKYGLIGVDLETFEREIKPSARLLGQIAKQNKISLM